MTRARVALAFLLLLVTVVVALLATGCAVHRQARGLPPIPASVPTSLGPLPVLWVDSLVDPTTGRTLWGAFDPTTRRIYLSRAIAANRVLSHAVLLHERCHQLLHDSGLRNAIDPTVAQMLCDVFAIQQVADRLAP